MNSHFKNLLQRLQQQRALWLRIQGWLLRAQQPLLKFRSFVRRMPARWRVVLTTCVYGLVRLSHQFQTVFFSVSFVLLIGSSLIVAGWAMC